MTTKGPKRRAIKGPLVLTIEWKLNASELAAVEEVMDSLRGYGSAEIVKTEVEEIDKL